ncbi:hypothetical protein BGZ58_007142 [Dissophora ornata]|nr:hypothetical protein BGZ58_007142 [Dissophora ornata]
MNLEYDFVISEETRRHFHRDGFAIVRNALTIGEVEILRREVDCLINFLISDDIDIMADYGGIIEPISCGYIDPPVSQMYILSKKSYSSLRNMVTEEPDTVVPVLFEKMPALVKHFLPAETADNPLCLPVLVDIPAGSIVFLSGFVRHCSLGNPSLKFRRAWMPQFSSGKVVVPESGTFVSMAVPCNGSSDLDQERERAQERASGYEGELDMDLEELDSFMD